MSENPSSEDVDWFDLDEDKLLENIQKNTNKTETTVEYIKDIKLNESDNVQQIKTFTTTSKISITELRQISKLDDLEAFLVATTSDSNFFINQINTSDSHSRIIIYLNILVEICKLELPGFHHDILESLMNDEHFMDTLLQLSRKLFNKSSISMWKNESDVDECVGILQILFLKFYQSFIQTKKLNTILMEIQKLHSLSKSKIVIERQSCKDFVKQLQHMIRQTAEEKNYNAGDTKRMIYPTLDELLFDEEDDLNTNLLWEYDDDDDIVNNDELKYENAVEYIEYQMKILREDFIIPIRVLVNQLRKNQNTTTLPVNVVVFENVLIQLNADFDKANRNEMLFANITNHKNKQDSTVLSKIKPGSLLCFATNFDFENLILATVTFTNFTLFRQKLIGIEIVHQYNIGNIYEKEFIMFEAPTFLEPYKNAYDFLKTCDITNLPMKNYIINGVRDVKSTKYLKKDGKSTIREQSLPNSTTLNSSQLEAYHDALSHELALIQGPPGTGKTEISLHLIRTLMENSQKPILLITYTNASLDKFLLKLSRYTENIVRFGSQIRLPEIGKYNISNSVDSNYATNGRLKRLHYVTKLEFNEKYAKLQDMHTEFDGSEESYQQIVLALADVRKVINKQNTIRLFFQYFLAREKGIIAMTTTCAAKTNFLFQLLKSEIVIFEEAAEILESHIIACFTPYTKHVIMIGDHMQLKPYTSNFKHDGSNEMNISLFERLIRNKINPSVLKIQYRMRPNIANLICPIFYPILHNDSSVENYPKIAGMTETLYFLSHKNPEKKFNFDFTNKFEVDTLLELANHLFLKNKFIKDDIVILSPYTGQVNLFKKNMSIKQSELIQVHTVDSFQGLEAKVILLSLVRSNEIKEIGFLRQSNRICVALSRAKHALYIVGNMKILAQRSRIWRQIDKILITNNAIGDTFPFDTDTQKEISN